MNVEINVEELKLAMLTNGLDKRINARTSRRSKAVEEAIAKMKKNPTTFKKIGVYLVEIKELANALDTLKKEDGEVGFYNGMFYSMNALPAIDFLMEHGQVVSSEEKLDEDGYISHVEYRVRYNKNEVVLIGKYASDPHAFLGTKEDLIQVLESDIFG